MFFFNFLLEQPYIAIIGDIKDSKKIEHRNQVQINLKKILKDINEEYKEDIASNFTITLGDEFQGLLKKSRNLIKIISEIERKIYPIKIRFGIGLGDITTEIDREISIGADGPGYYMAREAIEYLKDSKKIKSAKNLDIRLEADCKDQSTVVLINTIFTLISIIKSQWSDRQTRIIWDMMEHQDNQTDVAKRFNIKQPAVQKFLSKGNYNAYSDALEVIKKTLEQV